MTPFPFPLSLPLWVKATDLSHSRFKTPESTFLLLCKQRGNHNKRLFKKYYIQRHLQFGGRSNSPVGSAGLRVRALVQCWHTGCIFRATPRPTPAPPNPGLSDMGAASKRVVERGEKPLFRALERCPSPNFPVQFPYNAAFLHYNRISTFLPVCSRLSRTAKSFSD